MAIRHTQHQHASVPWALALLLMVLPACWADEDDASPADRDVQGSVEVDSDDDSQVRDDDADAIAADTTSPHDVEDTQRPRDIADIEDEHGPAVDADADLLDDDDPEHNEDSTGDSDATDATTDTTADPSDVDIDTAQDAEADAADAEADATDVDVDVEADAADVDVEAGDADAGGEPACAGDACPPRLLRYASMARAALRAEDNQGNYSFYHISAGDLTGNGHADLVVTDNRWPGPDGLGAIRVFEGPFAGLVERDATHTRFDAGQTRASLGATLVGDFNGDGQADLVILESLLVSGRSRHFAHVYFGPIEPGVRGVRSADVVIQGDDRFRLNGTRPCVPGDLDGDGRDDLVLVGSATREEDERGRAAAFVFRGSSIAAAAASGGVIAASDADRLVLSGPGASDACTSAPDLDGSGRLAFWMHGARETTPTGRLSDIIHWVGSERDDTLLLHEDAPFVGSIDNFGSGFGWALEGGRDVTGNGRPDLIIGHPYARNQEGMQTGMVLVVEVGGLVSGELQPTLWFQGPLNSEIGVWVGAASLPGSSASYVLAGEPYFAMDEDYEVDGSGIFFLSARDGARGPLPTWRPSSLILWESIADPSDGRGTSVGYSGVVADLTGDGCDDIAFGEFAGGDGEARVFIVSGCDLASHP